MFLFNKANKKSLTRIAGFFKKIILVLAIWFLSVFIVTANTRECDYFDDDCTIQKYLFAIALTILIIFVYKRIKTKDLFS